MSMSMRIRVHGAVAVLSALAIHSFSSTAVAAESVRPAWTFGAGAGALLPQGALEEGAGTTAAWEMFLGFRPRTDRAWGGRLTLAFASLAHSDTSFDLPGITADTRTSSDLYFVTLGPEVTVGQGRARGVVHASVGYANASTRTALRSETNDVGNTNRSDGAAAFEAGAALSLGLTRSDLLRLELGGRWFTTGKLTWVPENGIRRAGGALALTTREDALGGVVVRGALVLAIGPTRR